MADIKPRQPKHVTIGDIWIDVSLSETHSVSAEVTDHPVEEGANIADHIRPQPRTFSMQGFVTNTPIEVPKSHIGGARADSASIPIQAARSVPQRVPPQTVTIQGEPSLGVIGIIPGMDQATAILGAMRLEVRSKRQFAAEHHRVDNLVTQTYSATALHFTQSFDRVGEVHAALVNIVESSKLVTIVTGLTQYDSVALTEVSFERSKEVGRDSLKFSATARVLRIVNSEVVKLPDPVQPRAKPAKAQGQQQPQKTTKKALSGDHATFLSKALDKLSELRDRS